MNRFFKLLAVTCILMLTFNMISQAKEKNTAYESNDFESVWIWEIETPHRKIYLAAELHDHALSVNENLSHLLAETVYKLSSHVLTESLDSNKLSNSSLKNRLSATTWAELENAIQTSLKAKLDANRNITSAQRNVPIQDVIDVIGRMPDEQLFRILLQILRPLPEKEDVFRIEIGFLKRINSDPKYLNQTKQSLIEKTDNFWSEGCKKPGDTELMVSEILTETGKNANSTESRLQKIVNEFKNPNGTAASLNAHIENTALWSTLNKCTVRPRNLEWLEKIKNELNKDNQPLMIVAGAGHIVGETGVLALLCKEGFCKSKRIHLIDLE